MTELPRVLRFRAGGLELGVLVPEIAKIVDPAEVLRVPMAHPALAGLMVEEDGEQTPIFELHGLVDPRASFDEPLALTAFLLFDTPVGRIGLRAELVRGTLDVYERAEDDGDVDEAVRPALSGSGEADGDMFHFFSPGAFLVALDVQRPLRPEGDAG
jgi:chemotaxis signal transduction protein